MAAFFGVLSHHSIRAHSVAPIKPHGTRFSALGGACVVGAAIAAFASIALAQPASDSARAEPGASVSTPSVSAIEDPNVKVRAKSTALAFEFYSVPGNAFQPNDSSTTYATSNIGCRYATGGASLTFTTPLSLPAGSTVKYLKLKFYDASVGDSALYITEYGPVASVSFVVTYSQGTAGAGESLSNQVTHVVDPQNYSYALEWQPSLANIGQQICGALIAYYPPAPTAALCSLDADGNGAIDALSDGLLILRAMFGLTGTAVTNGAIGSGTPSRTTWAQLRDFFNTSCGANFAP